MPPEAVEYDSDSCSETDSNYSVTETQLGVSDGPLESQDQDNPLVSRMGGHIAWLPSTTIPPPNISLCLHCSQQMELLVQIFAPLDESPYDRLLLVWGCARGKCQKKKTGR
jgi:pre-rRNA-processing protein TSR4